MLRSSALALPLPRWCTCVFSLPRSCTHRNMQIHQAAPTHGVQDLQKPFSCLPSAHAVQQLLCVRRWSTVVVRIPNSAVVRIPKSLPARHAFILCL